MKKIKQYLLRKHNSKKCYFGKNVLISKNSTFEGKNYVGDNSLFKNSKLGFQSYVGNHCEICNTKIGKFSCISHHVIVVEGQHPTNTFVSIHPSFYRNDYKYSYSRTNLFDNYRYINCDEKIACIIGNDVWIGYGAIIMSGVTIGDGAIVAAGSLVTKDVEPYSIVAGVPAKTIKKRFDEPLISKLQGIHWWDKDEEWLLNNCKYFNNVNDFLKIIDKDKTE